MRNDYETSEVIELGKAHDEILDQKVVGFLDSFGVPTLESARLWTILMSR